jgi:long-chain fatty acid transport protein
MKRHFNRNVLGMMIAAAFAGGSGTASAAGFALIEQNASGMGNAYAGAAAVAEDASTIFFNPAGLTKLQGKNIAVAGHLIDLGIKFSNNGNSTAPTSPAPIASIGNNGGDAGDKIPVPNVFFSMPIGEQLTFGIGVSAPFGLVTDYDAGWVGRFQGIKTSVETLNLNPTIAYKVSDALSVGFGINFQQFDAEFTNAVVLGVNTEGLAKLKADDDGIGWNAGVLFDVSPTTRIGASYRSTIDYTLKGDLTITAPNGANVVVPGLTGAVTADVTLPDMISVSLMQGINDKISLLADITSTRWSEIENVRIVNSASGGPADTLVLNFSDTMRYSVGLNYKYSDQLTFRFGLALDESPVDDSNRTVRLPDNDRTWIAIGGSYKVSDSGKLDFGVANLSTGNTPIDQVRTGAAANGRVAGSYDVSINIFSVQYSMSF